MGDTSCEGIEHVVSMSSGASLWLHYSENDNGAQDAPGGHPMVGGLCNLVSESMVTDVIFQLCNSPGGIIWHQIFYLS